MELNLLTPVRMSLRIKRSSLRPGETGDVMAHIRHVFRGKSKEETHPVNSLSDIERLYLESKIRTRGRRRRNAQGVMQVRTAAASPEDSCTSPASPTPLMAQTASHTPQPILRCHAKLRAHRPKTLLVDLPVLPFSQHKTYNDEPDFIPRHLFSLNDHSIKDDEARRVLVARNLRLNGALREWARTDGKQCKCVS